MPCVEATCVAGQCGTAIEADGATCSDGDGCTAGDTCQSGACVSGSPVTCSALDECHVAGTCDSATGACSNPEKADGTTCDDAESCSATRLVPGGGSVRGPTSRRARSE
ncbi:MAG: hypothetical protein R3B70_12060 [Polyangiaceae bacterium]